MTLSAFLLKLSCLVLIIGPTALRSETVEFSGKVTLNSLDGPPVAGAIVSSPGSPSSATGPKGRFSKIRPQDAPAQWLEVKAVKKNHAVVNALDMRRPLPATEPRTLNVILAATGEVSDRAELHWKKQVHDRWHTHSGSPKVADSEDETPLKSLAGCYGEWLSGLSPKDLSLRWCHAFRHWMDNKPGQALDELPLTVLTSESDPEERLRLQHLHLMILLSQPGIKPALAEAEQAAATHPQNGLMKFTLACLQAHAKNPAAAQKTFESLALQPDTPSLLRLRSLTSLAEIHFRKGSYEKVLVHFQQAVAIYADASAKELAYSERGGLATAKMNLAMAHWQLKTGSPDLRPLLNDSLALYRQMHALYPDLHAVFLSDALDTAASIATIQKEYSQAETLFLERADLHRTQANTHPAQHLPLLAKTLERLSKLAEIQSNQNQVIKYSTEAMDVLKGLSQPRDSEGYLPLAVTLHTRMGEARIKLGDYSKAQADFTDAISLLQGLTRIIPANPDYPKMHALATEKLALVFYENEELFSAAQAFSRAGELHEKLLAQGDEAHRINAFLCFKNVVNILQNAKMSKEALALALVALRHAGIIEASHPDKHPDLAEISLITAALLTKDKKQVEALPHVRLAVKLYREIHQKTPNLHIGRYGMALCVLSEIGDPKEADPLLDEAEALLEKYPESPDAPLLRETLRQSTQNKKLSL